jgi:16S rRNA U1498 N3-methylase RsmE
MQRFLLQTDVLAQEEIILKDEEIIYQLTKVLRAKINDQVIFFDGKTFCDYVYKIQSIDKKNIIFLFSIALKLIMIHLIRCLR